MQPLNRFSWRGLAEVFRGAVWLHVLTILAAGAALRWPLLALAPFFTTDSLWAYYRYAVHQLLAGQPFDSNMVHLPGYAAFLAAILGVTGTHTFAVVLIQHILGLAIGLLVYAIGRRMFHPLVGLIAGLVTVLDVELALYEHEIMPETLFIFLMVSAMSILVFGLERYHWRAAVFFGVVAGLLVMVRPAGLMFTAVVVIAPQRSSLGARAKVMLAALAGLFAVLLPVMAFNKNQYGVFALTSSMQRNMLVRIGDDLVGAKRESSLHRLLQHRGTGDPLLGQIKATIVNHPEGLDERFDLTPSELDQYLQRVAIDYIFADPLGHARESIRRAILLIAAPPGEASATGLFEWTRGEIEAAGGTDQLGIRYYDLQRNQDQAQTYDQATSWLQYGSYAGALVPLAVLAIARYPIRVPLLVVSLTLVLLPAAAGASLEARYRYPVVWIVYSLAAVGLGLLISEMQAIWAVRAVQWRRLLIGRGWDGILNGQLPIAFAILVSLLAVLGLVLAMGRGAFDYRPPVVRPLATLGSAGPPLGALLAAARATTPQLAPAPRAAVLLLAADQSTDQSVDVVGPVEDRPDGQRDHAVLLALGPEVHDQRVTFVELRAADGTLWDTTGWFRPLLVFQLEGGAVLSPRAVPGPLPPQLLGGDHLLLLAAARSIPPDTPAFREVTLHFRDGQSRTYPIDTAPLPAGRVAPSQELMPERWLARYAAPDTRVVIMNREVAMIMAAHLAPYAALQSIDLPADDLAAIRKWLHAEALERHAIEYVWVGNSAALKGEAATAVLDPTRLRPVLLEVQSGECPVRWRGLFVVATAAAATEAPLVPLTLPHALAAAEFQGLIRFSSPAVEPLAPGRAAMMSLDVTNRSTQRWYGTCSTRDYPVGVAVEGRRAPEAPWVLVGEALLTDDLPAGGTAQVAVEVTAPREVGRYELRARLVQRPDRVSPATPAMTSLVVAAGGGG